MGSFGCRFVSCPVVSCRGLRLVMMAWGFVVYLHCRLVCGYWNLGSALALALGFGGGFLDGHA